MRILVWQEVSIHQVNLNGLMNSTNGLTISPKRGAILFAINKLEDELGQRSSSPSDGVCEIKGKGVKEFRLYNANAKGKIIF